MSPKIDRGEARTCGLWTFVVLHTSSVTTATQYEHAHVCPRTCTNQLIILRDWAQMFSSLTRRKPILLLLSPPQCSSCFTAFFTLHVPHVFDLSTCLCVRFIVQTLTVFFTCVCVYVYLGRIDEIRFWFLFCSLTKAVFLWRGWKGWKLLKQGGFVILPTTRTFPSTL